MTMPAKYFKDSPGEKQSAPLTKPLRGQYPPGAEGGKLFTRDVAAWRSSGNGTPSPGTRKAGKSPQKSAVETMLLANQGGDFTGEDK